MSNVFVLNSEISAAIQAFAKSRKVSPNACLEAAAIALAMQPFENMTDDGTVISAPQNNKPVQNVVAVKRTPARVAGAKSIEFRAAVVAKADTLKGKRHTFAEIGTMFGIDAANAVNNLKWLQKNKQINYQVVGHATKAAGQKGRAPAIIEFV